MIKLNDREIKLNRDQYMQLGSDYNILSDMYEICLLYTSPSPRDATLSRMPSSA